MPRQAGPVRHGAGRCRVPEARERPARSDGVFAPTGRVEAGTLGQAVHAAGREACRGRSRTLVFPLGGTPTRTGRFAPARVSAIPSGRYSHQDRTLPSMTASCGVGGLGAGRAAATPWRWSQSAASSSRPSRSRCTSVAAIRATRSMPGTWMTALSEGAWRRRSSPGSVTPTAVSDEPSASSAALAVNEAMASAAAVDAGSGVLGWSVGMETPCEGRGVSGPG